MQTHQKRIIRLERVLGIILLIPPVIGVLLFIVHLFFDGSYTTPHTDQLGVELLGGFYNDQHTPAAPIYLGLMAIAGAILLKGTDKK